METSVKCSGQTGQLFILLKPTIHAAQRYKQATTRTPREDIMAHKKIERKKEIDRRRRRREARLKERARQARVARGK
jgi:hypothetical protein